MNETVQNFTERYHAIVLTAFRVVFGLLFLWHGLQKFGITDGKFAAPGMPMFFAAGVIEIIAGLFILLGLFTRIAAFIASGEMAVAFFIGHVASSGSIIPLANKGEPAVLFCFAFLYLAFFGGGKWSLDKKLYKKRQ